MAQNKEIVDIVINEYWDHKSVERLYLRGFLGNKAAYLLKYRITKAAQKAVLKEEKKLKQKTKG